MPELVPWGYGGIQLNQQYRMNEQLMQMRDLAMETDQAALEKQQKDNQIQQEAASYLSQIAKGQTVASPGGSPQDTESSYAGAFRKTGAHLMEAGAPTQALEYFKAAATLDKNETDAAKAQLDQQKDKAEILLKQSDIMARDLGDAKNQEQWNQGLQAMEESGLFPPEIVQKYKDIPFHPQAAATIRERALSVKDKAQLEYQQQQEARIQANADRTASLQMQRLAFDKQKAANRQREKALAEKTGKAATAPTTNELKSVEASVANLIFNGKPPSQYEKGSADDSPGYLAYKAGVQDIAANAKRMIQENRGLSWQAAVSRATLMSKSQGDWDIQTETVNRSLFNPFGDEQTTATFNGVGKRPEDALPIPMVDNKPNIKALKKGRWYLSPTGKKGKWNGSGFDVIE